MKTIIMRNEERRLFLYKKSSKRFCAKQMKNLFCHLLLSALVVSSLSGCRKDLCFNHDEHSLSVKIDVAADWELEWERTYDFDWQELWDEEWGHAYDDLRPEAAKGIRAVIYHANGSFSESNLPQAGGRLPMPEGTHDVLLYNNDTEYIVFDRLSTAATATATTRGVTRSSLGELHAGERTVNQPDQLYGCYDEEYTAQRTLQPVPYPVVMHPLTYTYYIRYKFDKGLKYVALARGALAGMAESVYLSDGHTGDQAATVLFDCVLTDWGVETQMQSFGVPNYPGDHYTRADGSSAHYLLNLEVRLQNGKILSYEFDVTDQVNGQPRGGVISVDGIVVSDEDGTEGSGGFDVDVDGWGDQIDIPLPIG